MTNILRVRCFYVCYVSMNSFNLIRSLESSWQARRGPNPGRSNNSHWSSTKCDFHNFKQIFGDWKCRPKIGARSQTCNNAKRRSLFNVNGSKTLKHKCHSSSTAPSLGYQHRNYDTICPKSPSRCRSVCLLTNSVCQINKSPSNSQEVGDRACALKKK